MIDWPHQIYGVDEVLRRQAAGQRRIVLTSPTGGGKTRMIAHLIDTWLNEGLATVVYTNRKLLVAQLRDDMRSFGFQPGVRAASQPADPGKMLQIASLQTEYSRAIKKKTGELHAADRYVIDEAHLNANPTAQHVMDRHDQEGAYGLGITATPFDLGHAYQTMVVAGSASECRACGALVEAHHYGPDEPELRDLGRLAQGEDPTKREANGAIMRNGIFGRMMEWLFRINPWLWPTILFAPGVRESLWFAEQLCFPEKREPQFRHYPAVPAAHIDGSEVWINGYARGTSEEARNEALEASRTGAIKVLCNRFVLREGINAPWLRHGIFCTLFGLQSYLQSGGRLLRAFSGKEFCTIQDHGGNWHRHGSLNADRIWRLGTSQLEVTALREERLRAKRCTNCGAKLDLESPDCPECGTRNEPEPRRCPQCGKINGGARCACGYIAESRRPRPVVQHDGTLKFLEGPIYKERIVAGPQLIDNWVSCYYRAKNSKRGQTFRSAFGLFCKENYGQWPNMDWPFMPRNPLDQFANVADVTYDQLVRKKAP